jgi:predicted nucleic acid-binding protein
VTFVLDNSVALTWCFEDERTPATTAVLERLTDSGAVAPALWPLEALNGLLAAERRGRLDASRRRRLAGFLRALPIAIDDITAAQAWSATMRLAERFALTLYDTAYLELAHRQRLPLASLDQELRAAARALRIPLLGAQ